MKIEIRNCKTDEFSNFFDIYIDGVALSFNYIDDSHRGAYPFSHYRHKNNPNKLQHIDTQIAAINVELEKQDTNFEIEVLHAIEGLHFSYAPQEEIFAGHIN